MRENGRFTKSPYDRAKAMRVGEHLCVLPRANTRMSLYDKILFVIPRNEVTKNLFGVVNAF